MHLWVRNVEKIVIRFLEDDLETPTAGQVKIEIARDKYKDKGKGG